MNGGTAGSRSLYQAYAYASGVGGYAIPDAADPFVVNWWGNPAFTGTPTA